ncbi:efflux RND transporter periplasmic adaptor subunit [Pseudoalteromonas xiamenensis]
MNLNFSASARVVVLFSMLIHFSVLANNAVHLDDESHENTIKLTPQQVANIGLEIQEVKPRPQTSLLTLQGEVRANNYASYIVTPRTESIVIQRHVKQNDLVTLGTQLVTLFSPDIANEQANYLSAYQEWQRVKNLGSSIISDKDKQLINIDFRRSTGKLLAFGLDQGQIDALPSMPLAKMGQYVLNAEQAGVVIKDEFVRGQRIEAGTPLFFITDESSLWVDAQLPLQETLNVLPGTQVEVQVLGQKFSAMVTQQSHFALTDTRSRVVRLNVKNENDQLHPGMFVTIKLPANRKNVSVVPESALVRSSDGDWQVFIEHDSGEYIPIEVKRLGEFEGGIAIDDLNSGSNVVVKGAFYLASELAKAGFDAHNH